MQSLYGSAPAGQSAAATCGLLGIAVQQQDRLARASNQIGERGAVDLRLAAVDNDRFLGRRWCAGQRHGESACEDGDDCRASRSMSCPPLMPAALNISLAEDLCRVTVIPELNSTSSTGATNSWPKAGQVPSNGRSLMPKLTLTAPRANGSPWRNLAFRECEGLTEVVWKNAIA